MEQTLTIHVIVTKTITEIDGDFILRGTRYDTSTFSSDGSDHSETKKVLVCNLQSLLILCGADLAGVLTLSRRFNTQFSESTESCSERFHDHLKVGKGCSCQLVYKQSVDST